MKTKQFDLESYIERITSGPCFLCEINAGNPAFSHHVIFENEDAIVFLNKFPTLYGYTLVAPRTHLEHVVGDFSIESYLRLQALIFRVAQAVRKVTPTERVYILSLGSHQANSHVHWHIVPLPPGVPFSQQQLEALRMEDGVLDLSEQQMAALAFDIRQALLDTNSAE